MHYERIGLCSSHDKLQILLKCGKEQCKGNTLARYAKIFITILSGFFLWYPGFFLITPLLVIAQDGKIERGEATKALMKQMIPGNLPPGIAPEKLPEPNSLGAKHLQKYCNQCHEIFSPRMHSAEKWSSVFQRVSWHMQNCPIGEKMGRTLQIEIPSPQEETELLNYLKRHSLLAADQNNLEHLDTPIAIAFLQICAQCHALPDPKQHTTEEWLGVTARMKQNMQFMYKPLIQPNEEELIRKFLQITTSQ